MILVKICRGPTDISTCQGSRCGWWFQGHTLPTVSSLSTGKGSRGAEAAWLGYGNTKRVESPRIIEGLIHKVIVSVACGRNHTLALTEASSVFAFRENEMGQRDLSNQMDNVS